MNAQFNDDYYGEEDENFHYQDHEGGAAGEGGDYTTQELLALEGYDEGQEEYPEEGGYDEDYPEGEMNEEEMAEVKHMVNELYQLDYEDIVAGTYYMEKYLSCF